MCTSDCRLNVPWNKTTISPSTKNKQNPNMLWLCTWHPILLIHHTEQDFKKRRRVLKCFQKIILALDIAKLTSKGKKKV